MARWQSSMAKLDGEPRGLDGTGSMARCPILRPHLRSASSLDGSMARWHARWLDGGLDGSKASLNGWRAASMARCTMAALMAPCPCPCPSIVTHHKSRALHHSLTAPRSNSGTRRASRSPSARSHPRSPGRRQGSSARRRRPTSSRSNRPPAGPSAPQPDPSRSATVRRVVAVGACVRSSRGSTPSLCTRSTRSWRRRRRS